MDKIVIGVDASRGVKARLSGIEYYSRSIVDAILGSAPKKKVKFRLYSPRPLRIHIPSGISVEIKVMRFPILWSQLRLAIETIFHPVDVLFVPAHTVPLFARGKVLVTIHDLGFLHFPSLYPPLNRLYHKICARFSIRRAQHVIAISEFTKRDILSYYSKTDPLKIAVIHQGVNSDRFRPLTKTDTLKYRSRYGSYILFLGRLEYKKNIQRIVESYVSLRENYPGITHRLVLGGLPKYGFQVVERYIQTLPSNIGNDIIITGYLADADVPKILREADLFLFPTLFEGFGMPVIEAFASGVPVITSTTTSLPEVAGEAAILVNPVSVKEITEACRKIITDHTLRKTLREKGFARCRRFSWDKTGRLTLDILLDSINNV